MSSIYQTFNEEILTILYNLLQRIEAEEIIPNSFYKGSISLTTKLDKDITRKLETSISHV